MIRLVVAILIFCGSVQAQDGVRIHRHKLYDTTIVEDFQKIKRRRLTMDVDSTGMVLRAWGNDVFMKINLLQRMLINKTFYRESVINGHLAVMYGDNQFRFRMYINRSGQFEFDAIIRNKPPDAMFSGGKFRIPFDVDTKGIKFLYQPFMTLQDSLDGIVFRPDSAQDSWALYRNDGRKDNFIGLNGFEEHYKVGKVGHLFRPKAWDADGDTVWAFIRFNPTRTRMFIGVDSIWMSNATYPVTIDPTIGDSDDGTQEEAAIDFQLRIQYLNAATTGSGSWNIDKATVRGRVTQDAGTNENGVHIYTTASEVCANSTLVASATVTAVTNTSVQNNDLVMSGSLSGSTDYTVVYQGNTNGTRLRFQSDAATFATEAKLADTDMTGPSDLTGCSKSSSSSISAWVTYTESGVSGPPDAIHTPDGAGQIHGPDGQSKIHGPSAFLFMQEDWFATYVRVKI